MWRKFLSAGAALILTALSCLLAQDPSKAPLLAPYYPAPMGVVEKALELGELQPGELFYDLGSGDGRAVIMAAQKFGARAVGFEIDIKHVYQSRERIAKRSLSHLARIEHMDLMAADLSKPDLIYVYLLPDSNDKLQPLLEEQARKGARIVSLDFEFKGWEPEEVLIVKDPSDYEIMEHKLYLYRR